LEFKFSPKKKGQPEINPIVPLKIFLIIFYIAFFSGS
jgi:hypothetical protein